MSLSYDSENEPHFDPNCGNWAQRVLNDPTYLSELCVTVTAPAPSADLVGKLAKSVGKLL